MSNSNEGVIVAVTSQGQATIPKRFREELGIRAPGRVRFREGEDGAVVVERVPRPGEVAGTYAREDQPSPVQRLREEREREKRREREAFGDVLEADAADSDAGDADDGNGPDG